MEELPRLRASRIAYRAQLMRIYMKINDLMSQLHLDEIHISTLYNLAQQLQKKKEILKNIDEQIGRNVKELDELENEILETEEVYCTTTEKLSEIFKFVEIQQREYRPATINAPSHVCLSHVHCIFTR